MQCLHLLIVIEQFIMNDIYESSALVPAHQDSVLLTSFNDHSETFPSRFAFLNNIKNIVLVFWQAMC